MKKFLRKLFTFLIISALFAGCGADEVFDYPFVGTRWTRSNQSDTEYISFSKKGEFSYYCACGNPVNDSDLCEGYKYDAETNTITLDYPEKSKNTVTKIVIKKCTEDELVLDFEGDERVFKAEKSGYKTDTIIHENRQYTVLEYASDIFNYDLTVGGNYDEDTVYPIHHDKWDIIYYNNDLFVLDAHLAEATDYYANCNNYTWWAKVENHEGTVEYKVELSLSDADKNYLLEIENLQRNETIFYEEITQFATLAKTSSDGLINATTELTFHNNAWYWRSEIIDENTEGWPEYIIPLPKSLSDQIKEK